jgi:hypothetical protein
MFGVARSFFTRLKKKLPEHLGGHMGVTHTDISTLKYLQQKFLINTMVDIGCGPGGMIKVANDLKIEAMGVDGDYTIKRDDYRKFSIHDYSSGPWPLNRQFDLGWSVEFLEHIEEEYLPNVIDTFKKCKVVMCTAAPEDFPGYHHVNCRNEKYWIEKFDEYGFEIDRDTTNKIRAVSEMERDFIRDTGKVFINVN